MSLEQIINAIFGGQVDASKIVTILVGIWAVVKSITEWRAKKKLIKATNEQTALTQELKLAREELAVVKQGLSELADITVVPYLTSNSVPIETKRLIAEKAQSLNKVAQIPLADTTMKLINAVTDIVPEAAALEEHKEEIHEAAKLAEDAVDGANEVVQKAISKIKLTDVE